MEPRPRAGRAGAARGRVGEHAPPRVSATTTLPTRRCRACRTSRSPGWRPSSRRSASATSADGRLPGRVERVQVERGACPPTISSPGSAVDVGDATGPVRNGRSLTSVGKPGRNWPVAGSQAADEVLAALVLVDAEVERAQQAGGGREERRCRRRGRRRPGGRRPGSPACRTSPCRRRSRSAARCRWPLGLAVAGRAVRVEDVAGPGVAGSRRPSGRRRRWRTSTGPITGRAGDALADDRQQLGVDDPDLHRPARHERARPLRARAAWIAVELDREQPAVAELQLPGWPIGERRRVEVAGVEPAVVGRRRTPRWSRRRSPACRRRRGRRPRACRRSRPGSARRRPPR